MKHWHLVIDSSQQTQYDESMLVWDWPTIYDAGPTLNQHWFNVLFLLLCYIMLCYVKRAYLPLCVSTDIWSIPTKVMHIGKKTTLLHSPEFFSLCRRHMELSQKIYASSYYMIVATRMEFMLIIEHQSNPTNAYYVICKCHNVTKTLVAKSTSV